MAIVKDITGQRFGRLVAVRCVGRTNNGNAKWLCQCDCGNTVIARAAGLKHRCYVSCGCSKTKRLFRHGLADTRLDIIYRSMKQRCYDNNAENYYLYGGRGIRICDSWLKDKELFFQWAFQSGYSDSLSIDRIDVNGDYEPSNCRWVTAQTQSNNRRNNHYITRNGVTKTATEWAREFGINPATFFSRLHNGWSVERALNTSVSKS